MAGFLLPNATAGDFQEPGRYYRLPLPESCAPTMKLLGLLIQLLLAPMDWPTLHPPRRVFTRQFVATCVVVVIIELLMLNALFKG